MKSKLFFSIFFVVMFTTITFGQSGRPTTFMWVPQKFISPFDLQGEVYKDFLDQKSPDATPRSRWVVYSDRENNPCYKSPDLNAESAGATLKFLEQFYVLEERQGWIHIASMTQGQLPNGNQTRPGQRVEDRGWVPKGKMLLWNTGLKDQNTKISLKSFILYNYAAAVEIAHGNQQKKAPILRGPASTFSKGQAINLYDFYFILKKEGDYYLLSKDAEVAEGNQNDQILGWVHNNYQAQWNTRLTMEPNFDESAFKERSSNVNFQVAYYDNSLSAKEHSENGQKAKGLLSKEDADPVNRSKDIIDPKYRRLPGTITRLPVLSTSDKFFRTGFLGGLSASGSKLDPMKRAEIEDEFNKMSAESNNYDILFVVEATIGMQGIKPFIINSIERISRELKLPAKARFALAFYREPDFGSKEHFFKLHDFTSDVSKVVNLINQEDFYSSNILAYTTMYYAIDEAILKAGFGKNRNNLVFVIGNNPDFSVDELLLAKCNGCNALLTTKKLTSRLSEFNAHLTFILPEQKDEFIREDFKNSCGEILSQLANRNFDKLKSWKGLAKIENPNWNESKVSEGKLTIDNCPTVETLYFPIPSDNFSLSDIRMNEAISGQLNEIISSQNLIFDLMRDMLQDGKSLKDVENKSNGSFTEAIMYKLQEAYKNSGRVLDDNEKKALLESNLQLYIEAYSPKVISGANNPMYKPVMFFPKSELSDYIVDLQRISSVKTRPSDQRRKALYDALLSLFERFAIENRRGRTAREPDLNQLMEMLAGNGLEISNRKNFLLRSIRSEKDFPESDLNNFINDIDLKVKKLEGIIRGDYQFKYEKEGNTYYWIPFEDSF